MLPLKMIAPTAFTPTRVRFRVSLPTLHNIQNDQVSTYAVLSFAVRLQLLTLYSIGNDLIVQSNEPITMAQIQTILGLYLA